MVVETLEALGKVARPDEVELQLAVKLDEKCVLMKSLARKHNSAALNGRPAKRNSRSHHSSLPKIIGQEQLKLALELLNLAPRLGGVLIAGQRGTAKSTAVRAFALMMYGQLPVTLPY
jgi:hypothetical protein